MKRSFTPDYFIMTIISEQFLALRDGDRFYYQNDPWISLEEKGWIHHLAFGAFTRVVCRFNYFRG